MIFNTPTLCTISFGLLSSLAFAAEESEPVTRYFPGWHSHSHGFWWIIPFIIFLFFIFAIPRRHRHGWFGPWPYWGRHPYDQHHASDYSEFETKSALSILHERYARGEIEKDEYEEKKATLTQK